MLVLWVAGPVRAGDPAAIPGDLTHVAAGRTRIDDGWSDFRLVVTGVCSPEHCFSRGRIEWVDGPIPGSARVVKTVTVEELESALVIRSVVFDPWQESKPASFELRVVNSYTSKEGTLVLSITGVGRYEARLTGDPLGAPD